MNSNSVIMLLSPGIIILMLAWPLLAVLSARLSRPDLFFSVTIDHTLRSSDAGHAILRRFSRAAALWGVVGLALAIVAIFAPLPDAVRVGVLIFGAGLETAGIIAAYASARRAAKAHHVPPSGRREVSLTPRRARLPGGWLGQAGPLLVLALAALCLWLKWDAIPARFPIHWGLQWHPDGWATKSLASVFFAPVIGALVCLFFGVLFSGFARGVRRIHSAGPEAEKEYRNLRNMLRLILGLQYWFALLFALIAALPLVAKPEGVTLLGGIFIAISILATIVILAAVVVTAFRSGQGGWRLPSVGTTPSVPATRAPVGDRTPDECWKGGVFYYNPDDPALWVEKRFGYGWTVNFGNPRSWLLIGGMLLFAVAIPCLTIVLIQK